MPSFAFLVSGVLLITISLATSSANAQELVPDFRTNGYLPPVHIPPRKPIYDPGLPDTLNGKFNSVQRIQSDMNSGQHIVISDHSDLNQNYRGQRNSVRNLNRGQGGFQDRIANLITRQETPRTNGTRQTFNKPRPVGSFPKWQTNAGQLASGGNVQRTRSNEAGQSPLQQQADVNVQRYSQRGFEQSVQPRVSNDQRQVRYQHQQRRQQQSQFNNNKIAESNLRVSNELGNVQQNLTGPNVSTASNARKRSNVQAASLQQLDGDRGQFSPDVQSNPGNFVSPRGQAFRSNPDLRPSGLRTSQQPKTRSLNTQLPISNQKTIKQAAPVSVLNDPAGNSFELPGSEFEGEGEVMLSSPESNELNGAFESEYSEPEFNVLRNNARFQDEDEPELGSDLEDADLDDDFEDLESDESDPMRKSCEEFRRELLNTSITDIALDISPPGKIDAGGDNVFRTWRDQYGNELAQGTISDLRRGYLIVNSSNGGQVRLPYARLSDADWLAVADYWRIPIECGLGTELHPGRCWSPQTATWYASNVCHKPLYFENIQLERYGHSHGPFVQPAASTVHFFGKLFFLPYNTAINPPNECQYALGFYRPGNCAPWLKDPFPISLSGASRQSLVYTGIGFLAD